MGARLSTSVQTGLGSTQPPVQWIPAFFPRVQELAPHSHLVSMLKKEWNYTSTVTLSLNGSLTSSPKYPPATWTDVVCIVDEDDEDCRHCTKTHSRSCPMHTEHIVRRSERGTDHQARFKTFLVEMHKHTKYSLTQNMKYELLPAASVEV